MKTAPNTRRDAKLGGQDARYWRAVLARDGRADGAFFFAVRSTSIYCRPSCPARRPLRTNTLFFQTRQEAEQHGYRPCRRCKPDTIPASVLIVKRAAQVLESEIDDPVNVNILARKVGVRTDTLRRAFRQQTGLNPKELAAALRLKRFKRLLRSGNSIADALYATGYGSASRVYERSDAQLGMTPATYQKGGKGMQIKYTTAKSSLGEVLVAATERGVSAVYLGDASAKLTSELREEYPRAEITPEKGAFSEWVEEIVARVEGNAPRRELPLDLQATAFQRRVWQELQRIPRGATRTYAQVAKAVGKPSAVRAVARACATNPVSIVVPCHRVVRADGNLAGYRWGISRKQTLLERERTSGIATGKISRVA
ncbi:MAG TPA: bifunctional DNA-binding transcriptional regulator/O6-methylguanine-DNA methyltransferase Ada [Candidatus Acidoferrum sp.]|nr:bifunctional DNA-binding transcriptional regulator/O6-methylguanine-DNA methyltransferase Ada [Candidatus Acidoferrum sp.]